MMGAKKGGAKKRDSMALGRSFELVRKINEYARQMDSLLAQGAW